MKDPYAWESNTNPRKETMTGVTVPHRKCHICGKYKTIPGSSQAKGKFICAECKNANKSR